jgi:hypothetical protein
MMCGQCMRYGIRKTCKSLVDCLVQLVNLQMGRQQQESLVRLQRRVCGREGRREAAHYSLNSALG